MSHGTSLTRKCSFDGSFEVVDFTEREDESDSPIRRLISNDVKNTRGSPVNKNKFLQLFDEDGRLVDEHALRKAVFKGGITSDARPQIWQFLYGLYPFTSTTREREQLLVESYLKYEALKQRWKEELLRCKDDPEVAELLEPKWSRNLKTDAVGECDDPVSRLSSTAEGKQQVMFMKVQAQVYAGRQDFDLDQLKTSIRVIDKDVPRTDKDQDFFKGEFNSNMLKLRDILVTFAAFLPEVGYAQGMNDICSKLLIVLKSEVEAFWCFRNFIEKIQLEFVAEGMLNKLVLLKQLLESLDPDLLHYLVSCEVGDMMFCHRWLILGFKREFSFEDGLKLFEILSSHHLELNSVEAEAHRQLQRRKDFEGKEGQQRKEQLPPRDEFTFDLFIAAAILMDHRDKLFRCSDPATVFQCIFSLSMNLDVDDTLCKSEAVFLSYCRKSVQEKAEEASKGKSKRTKLKLKQGAIVEMIEFGKTPTS